jgi:cytochrome P450
MSSLAEVVQLERPSFYDDGQYAVYDRMRTQAPAFYYSPLDVFALTRMSDVRWVSTHPEVFTSTAGLTLNQLRLARSGAVAAFERFNDAAGELVITKDPPRQRELRALIAPNLTPRNLLTFADGLDRICRDLLDALPDGAPTDFIGSVASRLPLLVAAQLLGVEAPDMERMQKWVWALEELTRVTSIDELEAAAQFFDEMKSFLRDQIRRKREQPGEDMVSLFLRSSMGGEPVPDAIVLSHVSTLMSNGGTTRLLLSNLAYHFARHPEDAEAVRRDPRLLNAAIEECLRLMPPARGFVRTATRAVEVGGQMIGAGQRVYLLYVAANRDPAVFPDPVRFDLHRDNNTSHAAFGFGTHFCLGAGLARMEAKVLFGQLLPAFPHIEVVGDPEPYPHVQLNGLATLPLVLRRSSTIPPALTAPTSASQ